MAEVADILKLNQKTVRNWSDRGKLFAVRVGQRRVRARCQGRSTARNAPGDAPGLGRSLRRNALISQAVDEGWTHAQISGAMGLARSRVSQLAPPRRAER